MGRYLPFLLVLMLCCCLTNSYFNEPKDTTQLGTRNGMSSGGSLGHIKEFDVSCGEWPVYLEQLSNSSSYSDLVDALSKHFQPALSEIVERFKFRARKLHNVQKCCFLPRLVSEILCASEKRSSRLLVAYSIAVS